MGSFFSRRQTRIHFPSQLVYFNARQSASESTEIKLSLRSIVETKCPSLFQDFKPAWWLFNGHLQTIYCVIGDFSQTDRIHYRRTLLRLKDGGTIGLDFTPVNSDGLPDNAPIIIVQHGLTGGSYESYVRSILAPACTPKDRGGLGCRGVVVNFRGCADVPITSQQLYSAGHTEDLRAALVYISHLYPQAPLYGIGFSLGANVLARYLAEEGDESRIIGACILACPWDLRKNNDVLNSTLIGRNVYAKAMGGNLFRLLKRHLHALSADPAHRVAKAIPATLQLKSPTLGEFDTAFTRVAGGSSPPFPFPTANDYYDWASSHKVIKSVKVPILAINSADDPVVQDVPMDAGGNPYAVMTVTPNGGHLGWFESQGLCGVTRWIKRPVLEWFKALIEDVDLKYPKGRPIYVDSEGYLREEGSENGCREDKMVGVIDGTLGEGNILQGL